MKHFERIQKYLDGEMTEAEQQAFLAEMQQDEALAEDVKIQQFEENALEWMMQKTLHQKLQHYRMENASAVENRRPFSNILKSIKHLNTPWLWSAAAVSLLLLAFFSLSPTPPTSPSQLADELNKQHPPASNLLRSTEENEYSHLREGLEPLYDSAHYNFRTGNYPEAIIQYQAYISVAPSSFRKVDEMEFYLFLALLKNEQIDEAKQVATRISMDSTHRFQTIVAKALKQLK